MSNDVGFQFVVNQNNPWQGVCPLNPDSFDFMLVVMRNNPWSCDMPQYNPEADE